MRFGSRGPSDIFSQIRQIAWEVTEQGLGMAMLAMSTLVSEKNRELLFIGNVFYKQ